LKAPVEADVESAEEEEEEEVEEIDVLGGLEGVEEVPDVKEAEAGFEEDELEFGLEPTFPEVVEWGVWAEIAVDDACVGEAKESEERGSSVGLQ
jgi:hypothetical protein